MSSDPAATWIGPAAKLAKPERSASIGPASSIVSGPTPIVARPQGQWVAIALVVLMFMVAGWSGYKALSTTSDESATIARDLGKEAMALRELVQEAKPSLPADPPGQSGVAPSAPVTATDAARAEAEAAAKAAAEELEAKAAAERLRAEAAAKSAADAAARAARESTARAAAQPAPRPASPPPRTVPPPAKVQAAPPAPPEPAPKVAAAPAPPPASAAPRADPLVTLREELARCETRDLFSRLGCVNRARNRHCEPYWGKIPECPNAMIVPPDKGQ